MKRHSSGSVEYFLHLALPVSCVGVFGVGVSLKKIKCLVHMLRVCR